MPFRVRCGKRDHGISVNRSAYGGAMGYDIRPLSFMEVLYYGFTVFFDDFVLLAGSSALVVIPNILFMFILHSLIDPSLMISANPRDHLGVFVISAALLSISEFIFTSVMMAAVTAAVVSVYLHRLVPVGDVYRSAGNVFARVIGTQLLSLLLIFLLLFIPVIIVLGKRTFLVPDYIGIFVFIASAIPFGYFTLCWSLVYPVMIVEHRFGMTALRRSRQLVRGVYWKTARLFFVTGLIAGVTAAVLNHFWPSIPILEPILTAITSSIAAAYILVVQVIYYFDRRCRNEIFDLQRLAEDIRRGRAVSVEPGAVMHGVSKVGRNDSYPYGSGKNKIQILPRQIACSQVESWLVVESDITAKKLVARLTNQLPNLYFTAAQFCSLKRRVKVWRAHCPRQIVFSASSAGRAHCKSGIMASTQLLRLG